MKKIFLSFLVLLMAVALLPATAPAATQVFFTDFNSGAPPEISGIVSHQGVYGFAAYGFSGDFLRNSTNLPQQTILTLSGLPAHTSIDINFLFGAIDSWDSNNGSVTPDYFNVTVDGVLALQATFANASGSNTYANGALSGLIILVFNDWGDRAYNMGDPTVTELHNIAHTANTVTIAFFASGAGWQGGIDESWAIENLEVRITEVTAPLPDTMFLMGSGLLGLIGWRLRRS